MNSWNYQEVIKEGRISLPIWEWREVRLFRRVGRVVICSYNCWHCWFLTTHWDCTSWRRFPTTYTTERSNQQNFEKLISCITIQNFVMNEVITSAFIKSVLLLVWRAKRLQSYLYNSQLEMSSQQTTICWYWFEFSIFSTFVTEEFLQKDSRCFCRGWDSKTQVLVQVSLSLQLQPQG